MKRDNSEPLYAQLAETVKKRIEAGELKSGERMPTVREMCRTSGLSGGTVRQAYALLKSGGFIEVTQGRGTFVKASHGEQKSRKSRALEAIDGALSKLYEMGFSNAEARMFISLRLAERDADRALKPVALVAESPEGMRAVFPRVCGLKNTEPTAFVIDEIRGSASEALSGFQLIIAHGSLMSELSALLGKRASLLTPYACAPTGECLKLLYARPRIVKTALFAQSDAFLSCLRLHCNDDASAFRAGAHDFPEKLLTYSRLICAPDRAAFAGDAELRAIRDFEAGGGEVIEFNVDIDDGSMFNIISRVSRFK